MLLNFLVVGKTQIFFRQMQLRDISGEKTGEETEVGNQTIWFGQVLKRSSNDERKPFKPRVCWKTRICFCCKGKGRIEYHGHNTFLVGGLLCRSTRDIHLSFFFELNLSCLKIVWNIRILAIQI